MMIVTESTSAGPEEAKGKILSGRLFVVLCVEKTPRKAMLIALKFANFSGVQFPNLILLHIRGRDWYFPEKRTSYRLLELVDPITRLIWQSITALGNKFRGGGGGGGVYMDMRTINSFIFL